MNGSLANRLLCDQLGVRRHLAYLFSRGINERKELWRDTATSPHYTAKQLCLGKDDPKQRDSLPFQIHISCFSFILRSKHSTCCSDEKQISLQPPKKTNTEKATENWERKQDSASWLITSSESNPPRSMIMVIRGAGGHPGPGCPEERQRDRPWPLGSSAQPPPALPSTSKGYQCPSGMKRPSEFLW